MLAFPGARSRPSTAPAEGAVVESVALPSPAQACPGQVEGTEAAAERDGYGEVFSRLSQRIRTGDAIAASERVNAPIRYAELLSRPESERLELVVEDHRFHSYLLAEMLLERCREAGLGELGQARSSAELAVAIAQRLDEQFYGRELKLGLEVKARSVFGNILRKQGNLAAAETAFEGLGGLLEELPVESVERCDALSLKVSLLNDQNRSEEAIGILDELVGVLRRANDGHKLGKVLIKYGNAQSDLGNLDGAIESQLESLRLLKEVGDARLSSVALTNLARHLEDAGKSDEALRFLGQAREWMEANDSQEYLARARWLEGRIAVSLDREEEAEEAFQFAREFFAERAIDIESAMACLDLALLYARQGQTVKLKRLAAEMVPIFERQGLDRQVMAALILLQHAAEKEIATLGLVQEIASYVKRTQEQLGS